MLNPILQVKDQHPTEVAILNSALNLFLLSGEGQVSVTRLIQAAGISRSVFYYYFSGKDDVYAALLLTDEMGLSPLFIERRQSGDLSDLMRDYLIYRLQSVEKYRFLSRIEKQLVNKGCQLDRFVQWQRLRRNHIEQFSEFARQHMDDPRARDDDTPRFYYGLVWAVADGVASMADNELYHDLIQDRRGFKRFLAAAVSQIGGMDDAT